ncbi:dTDP-4-dehydrorhamnose reductase [Shewanella algidipiscicola]|uniref:dTDP-4-dehydrorhamnose reductase n=1 Tax=Shewanella algidipiscicola TaxID=614070 RepID=UPI000D789F03|nr:dTDP-4-dehydrorhamnose reductase [Shewanella algidipiscicola]
MKILVTGCNGQVGRSLTRLLAQRDAMVVIAADRDTLDITDNSAVAAFILANAPDIIINAAAYTAVDKAEDEVELAFAINSDGPKFIALAAQQIGATLLHISTDYVFAGDKQGLYQESDSPAPQSVYGESKLAGERAVMQLCDKHIIMRTAWVFSEHGNNFVKTMLRLADMRDSLSIVGDQFGGPTYAGDIASALLTIADAIATQEPIEYGVYHYSGLPHVSWYEFADAIFDIAVNESLISNKPKLTPIPTQEYPTPAKRPVNSMLDTAKITQHFGIEASDWKQVLNTNIHAYKG